MKDSQGAGRFLGQLVGTRKKLEKSQSSSGVRRVGWMLLGDVSLVKLELAERVVSLGGVIPASRASSSAGVSAISSLLTNLGE